MSITNTLYETALQLSDPEKYDNILPEQRTAAIEAALQQQQNISFTSSETSQTVALRAICDPWSSTRKKMSKIICEKINQAKKQFINNNNTDATSDNNSNLKEIESWILASSKKVLQVSSQQQKQTPWYEIDGLLLFIKMFLEMEDDEVQRQQNQSFVEGDFQFAVGENNNSNNNLAPEEASSTTTKSKSQKKKTNSYFFFSSSITQDDQESNNNEYIHIIKNCQSLLRLILPQCVHPQECVRDCAADIVVSLLARTTQSSQDDDAQEKPISLQSIIESVVSSKINLKSQWWSMCGNATENHLIDLGKLALANRGIGISKLFDQQEETLLEHWASSKHASVRFSCSSLFAKNDFEKLLMKNNDDTNNDQQVRFRLLTLALNKWLLSPSSSWMMKETAAIGCGDLLKSYLPRRYSTKAVFDNDDPKNAESSSSSPQQVSRLLKQVEKMGNEKFEPVFDVRRACAELLPLLCQYFVATSASITFIVDVLLECFDGDVENNNFCCQGQLQLGTGSSSSSCCAAQNLLWFLILKASFISEYEQNMPSSSSSSPSSSIEERKAALSIRLKNKLFDTASSSNLRLLCPRVKLLFIVYGRGLFNGENIFASDASTDLPFGSTSSTILPCDVRWLADMLRMNPLDVLQSKSAISLLEFCLNNYLDSYVQELIFTALHDVAHIYAALLIHSKEEKNQNNIIPFELLVQNENNNNNLFTISPQRQRTGSSSNSNNNNNQSSSSTSLFNIITNSNVSPFLFAMDTSRFAPPALQQDGSDALSDGTLWIQMAHDPSNHSSVNYIPSSSSSSHHQHQQQGSSSALRRSRGSFVTTHSHLLLSNNSHNNNKSNHPSSSSSSCHHHSWCEITTVSDQDKIYTCIEKLSQLSSSLLNILLLTGKSSSSIEYSSLSRAADATRSLTRAISGLVVVNTTTTTSTASSIPVIIQQKSLTLIIEVLTPWISRFDLLSKKSGNGSPNSSNPPKKASESNWDDSSSSEEEDLLDSADTGAVGLGAGGVNNVFVGSSVTKEQERECCISVMRHLSHVITASSSSINQKASGVGGEDGEDTEFEEGDENDDDDNQEGANSLNNKFERSGYYLSAVGSVGGGGHSYEPERVELVKILVEDKLKNVMKNEFKDAYEKLKDHGCELINKIS